MKFSDLVQISITKQAITGTEIAKEQLLEEYNQHTWKLKARSQTNERGIELWEKSCDRSSSTTKLSDVLKQYRSLLASADSENIEKARKLGKLLYKFLILPIEPALQNKKELIIMPDASMAMIPFETLIDEKGQYLTERFTIRYTHSASVLQQLKGRDYLKNRKPMLAIGGIQYGKKQKTKVSQVNPDRIAHLRSISTSTEYLEESFEDAYALLEDNEFQNLPGSQEEIDNINSFIPQTELLQGEQAGEHAIKKLSSQGKLNRYQVIHFATHAQVIQAIPGMSAIVMSQVDQGKEDNYLRVSEIARLNMKADFVNLSACETGIGKVFRGEGMVGFTQSFLLAGANSLSVSLWNIRDKSTSAFMSAFYKLLFQSKGSYPNALKEIKLRFIRGEFGNEYKAPVYWAPFVFYGKKTQSSLHLYKPGLIEKTLQWFK